MNIKSLSEIIEELKEMPQEDINGFSSGEEFEKWLKTKKEHYKNNEDN